MNKSFTELSTVRLRRAMTDEKGRPVDAGTTGTIVHVQPTSPDDEPAYVVEVVPNTAGLHLVDARHGDLALVKPFVPAPKTPWLSGFLFGGASLFGIASAFSISFCVSVARRGDGGAAIGYLVYVAPFLVILPAVLIALPSGILFRLGRRRLDLASLLLSGATVLVTITEVVVLWSMDFRGC